MAVPDPLTLYADTILVDGWCLRSALVRYAQAEARRSTQVHAFMRRLDAALALADADRRVELVPVVARFEALASTMSAWAADRHAHAIPTPGVDALLDELPLVYEQLSIPEESIDPAQWRGLRSSEGRGPRPSSTSAKEPKEPKAPKEPRANKATAIKATNKTTRTATRESAEGQE